MNRMFVLAYWKLQGHSFGIPSLTGSIKPNPFCYFEEPSPVRLKACSPAKVKPSTSQHCFILLKLLTSGTQGIFITSL